MSYTLLGQGPVTWINLVSPTDDDLTRLQRGHPEFHPLNIHDCRATLEYPKLEHYDNYLFLVMHFPVEHHATRYPSAHEIDIFIAKGLLVTVHHGELKPLADMFTSCEHDEFTREQCMSRGASPLLYSVLNQLVNYCHPIVRKVDDAIRHIEADLFSEDPRHIIEEIAIVRRDLIALRRIIRPQLGIIRALEEGSWPWIHDDLTLYWKDLRDEVAQLVAMLEDDAEVIQGLADTIDTLASQRINEVVRVLTLATVISLPVTLITTIYGMNVALPGSDHLETFFAVLVFCSLPTVGVIVYLKRQGFL